MKPAPNLRAVPTGDGRCPSGRSAALRVESSCTVSKLRSAAAIASERTFGSPQFIRRSRNPSLESPTRFEPTVKGENDVVI
jgi:hypothetical protein